MEEKKEKKYTTITIPIQLADKIEKRIENSGFNSVSSYVTYVLRQVVSTVESKEGEKKKEVFSKEDEEVVKRRLQGLGYM
tara:strand:+ start:4623 stop:4862 length:240 start_codon:yes stop_codon:yes gene_type:complete